MNWKKKTVLFLYTTEAKAAKLELFGIWSVAYENILIQLLFPLYRNVYILQFKNMKTKSTQVFEIIPKYSLIFIKEINILILGQVKLSLIN